MITAGSAAHASYRGATGADIGLSKWLLLRATDSLDLLVDSLNTFQPDLILGYPSIVTLLAAEQLAGRLHIHPRLVSTAGEVRTEDMELHIRKAWVGQSLMGNLARKYL